MEIQIIACIKNFKFIYITQHPLEKGPTLCVCVCVCVHGREGAGGGGQRVEVNRKT